MKYLCVLGVAMLAIHPLAIEHELCPLVCRVDANGIRAAWYETRLPYFQKTLWVSAEQKVLMEGVKRP